MPPSGEHCQPRGWSKFELLLVSWAGLAATQMGSLATAPGAQGGGGGGVKWGGSSACQRGASSTPPGTDLGSPQLPPAFCSGVGGASPLSPPLGPGLTAAPLQPGLRPISPDCASPGIQSWKMEPLSKSVDWELFCLGEFAAIMQPKPAPTPIPLAPFWWSWQLSANATIVFWWI